MTDRENKLNEVIKKHKNTVYRLACSQMKSKEDADDIFQEVFLRYIKKLPSFENEEHEKAWFIRVTLNCCKTNLKSFWKTKVVQLDESRWENEIDNMPVSEDALDDALKMLTKAQRAVIHLFYYEDLSVKSIAEALNISESNVRMQLTRARRRLKEILEKE